MKNHAAVKRCGAAVFALSAAVVLWSGETITWESMHGPPGAGRCLFTQSRFGSHALYVATSSGLYVSETRGDTWRLLEGSQDIPVHDMAVDGVKLYVAGNGVHAFDREGNRTRLLDGWYGRVFVSDGRIFAVSEGGRNEPLRIRTADPSRPSLRWEDISPAAGIRRDLRLPRAAEVDEYGLLVPSFVAIGDRILAGIVVETGGSGEHTNGRLFRSEDRGRSWTAVDLNVSERLVVANIVQDPADPNRLVLLLRNPLSDSGATIADLLRVSRDGGATWAPLTDLTFPLEGLTDAVFADSALFLVGPSSPFIHKIEGTTHEEIPMPSLAGFEGISFHLDRLFIDPGSPRTFYGRAGHMWELGIVRSDDALRTWRKIDRGIVATAPTIVAAHPREAGTVFASGNVIQESYVTRDAGVTWEPFSPTYADDEVKIDPHDPEHMIVIDENTTLFESFDGGRTFKGMARDFSATKIVDFEVASDDSSRCYVANLGVGISASRLGTEWQYLLHSPDYAYDIAIDPERSGVLYAANSPKNFERHAEIWRYDPTQEDERSGWTRLLRVESATGITSLVVDQMHPDNLYAGVTGKRGSVKHSSDRGRTWQQLNRAFTFTTIHELVMDPRDERTVYAAPWGGGLYRSTDAGTTWTQLECPTISVASMVVDPSDSDHLLIGDRTRPAVYASPDRGQSWKTVVNLDPDQFYRIFSVCLHEGRLYLSAMRRIDGQLALFKDPLSGATFRQDPGGLTELGGNMQRVVLSFCSEASNLYAVTHIEGVFQLDGDRWADISGDLPPMGFNDILVSPDHSIEVAGGCDLSTVLRGRVADPASVNQIYRRSPTAPTWTGILDGNPFRSGIKCLCRHPANASVLFAATGNGVYVSRGRTWTAQNDGLDFKNIGAMAVGRERVYVGTLGGGVYTGRINPDFSITWSASTGPFPEIFHIGLTIDPTESRTLYASSYPGGVFKTTDGGVTWAEANFGLPTVAVDDPKQQGYYNLVNDPTDSQVLYLGVFGKGLYRSADGADTWRPLYGANPEIMRAGVTCVRVDPSNPRNLYLGTVEGVYISTNRGHSWKPINRGLGTRDVRSLKIVRGSGRGIEEDFEHGTADRWELENGWSVTEEAGNRVLEGTAHTWARAGAGSWTDYTLTAKVKVQRGGLHTNVRVGDEGRYFVGLNEGGVYLVKQSRRWTEFSQLAAREERYRPGRWHELQITAAGPTLTVRLDGILKFTHTDSDPLLRGAIAFEALDDSSVRVDQVSVAITAVGSDVYAGTAGYGLFRLDRDREIWTHQGGTRGIGWWHVWERRMYQFSSILFDPDIRGRIYYGHFPGGFFVSEDGGHSWRDSSLGLGNDGIFSLTMHPRDHRVLFAGTYNGVVKSADAGTTWQRQSEGMPPEQWPYTIAIDPENPAVMYTSTKNGQNKGFCHRNEFCGIVMKSTDGGRRWFEIMNGLDPRTEFYTLLIHPDHRSVLFLSTSNGVFLSWNAGETWEPMNRGLPTTHNQVRDNVADNLTLTCDRRHLLLGLVGHGVWRADLSPLGLGR